MITDGRRKFLHLTAAITLDRSLVTIQHVGSNYTRTCSIECTNVIGTPCARDQLISPCWMAYRGRGISDSWRFEIINLPACPGPSAAVRQTSLLLNPWKDKVKEKGLRGDWSDDGEGKKMGEEEEVERNKFCADRYWREREGKKTCGLERKGTVF